MDQNLLHSGAFLLGLGIVIYAGIFSSYIYERFKIPDVLNLIFIGILLGPVFHVVNPNFLKIWMPLVGAIALSLILFEGGLDLDVDQIIDRFGLAFALATGTFLLNVTLISLIFKLLTASTWLHSLLLGTVLGCVSSAVILPVTSIMNIPEKLKTTVNLEAAFSDMWGVVLTVVLLRLSHAPDVSAGHAFNSIVGAFTVSVILALIFGLLLLWALDRLKKSPFAYMITLAAVFALYGLTELLHGSGPMAALAFGVVLTNADRIAQFFRKKFKFELNDNIRLFNKEVTFFVRTFFFVYLGLVVSFKNLNMSFFSVSGSILIAILISRYVVVLLSLYISDQQDLKNKSVYLTMIPRGLTSAVLVGVVQAELESTEYFMSYAFAVILLTNILMTAWVWKIEKTKSNSKTKKIEG